MNISELRQRLEAGETIKCSAWTFSATQMSCENGCCNDGLKGVDDAVKAILSLVDNLDELDEYNRKDL